MSRLAPCSQPARGGGGGTAAASASSADRAPLATTWQISNWPHFIDTDSDGTHPTLTAFDSRYDTDTVYTEDITSNEAAAAKYAPKLAEGQDIGQDAIVLSDWMAYQWIQAGYAQRLDPALLPHVNSLRIPPLRKRPIDPHDEFLIPWQAGLTGVIYDPAKTNGELSRVNDLFDPLFPGKITLLDNMRDTLGLVLMAMHVAPESASPDQAQAAADKIRTELVEPGKVLRFAGGDYVDDLVQGKVAAAFGWSTDYERLVQAKPELLFMIPNEGSLIWSDDILIPLAAQHPQNAHRFADYYYTHEHGGRADQGRAVHDAAGRHEVRADPGAPDRPAANRRHHLTHAAGRPADLPAGPRAHAGPPVPRAHRGSGTTVHRHLQLGEGLIRSRCRSRS